VATSSCTSPLVTSSPSLYPHTGWSGNSSIFESRFKGAMDLGDSVLEGEALITIPAVPATSWLQSGTISRSLQADTSTVVEQGASRCLAPAFGSERGKSIQACLERGNATRSWCDGQCGLVCGEAMCLSSWHSQSGATRPSPHCARLCHSSGGELEQIQFLLGHASVQTTERYIGSKQKLQDAVNDRLGISVVSNSA
jgi:hypothetical protein